MEIKIIGTEKELAGFVLGIQGGQARAPKAQDVKDFIRKSTLRKRKKRPRAADAVRKEVRVSDICHTRHRYSLLGDNKPEMVHKHNGRVILLRDKVAHTDRR